MLTFTLEEVQEIVNYFTWAISHSIQTMNMAMHDAIAKVNNLIAIKQKKLEEDQKRISEALAKRAKESEVKNECEDKSDKK